MGGSSFGPFVNRNRVDVDGDPTGTRMFPLTGTGLNTYGTAMLLFQEHDLSRHYAEAHNDYLQLAAEGGALVVLPAGLCLVLVMFVREVRRRFRQQVPSTSLWLRAGAVTALIAIALQDAVELSLQMPGNALMFAVTCAVALHSGSEPADATQRAGAKAPAEGRQSHG